MDAHRFKGLPATLAFMSVLCGCASRPTEHFYTVSSESVAPHNSVPTQGIFVSPIVIPALIDRPQLVVRTQGHEVAVLESHRWAEPLSVDLARALVGDLRRARPGLDIAAADAARSGASPQILDVVITELVSGPDASTTLEASWVVRDRLRNCASEGHLEATIPTQAAYSAIPVAYADAMSRLADAIARTIPQSDGLSCQVSASAPAGSTR